MVVVATITYQKNKKKTSRRSWRRTRQGRNNAQHSTKAKGKTEELSTQFKIFHVVAPIMMSSDSCVNNACP